jgi:hypothetical protein
MRNGAAHPLDDWQTRLAATFDDVTLRKLDLPQEPVTFALEHGLSEKERAELSNAIHESVVAKRLSRTHYICWAVYAAEMGYLYAGDEYWQTFEDQTPGWHSNSRPFIKSCFVRFAQEYNGANPKGAWARNFSIICWPITHSILPKDLQRQLAEILYRLRHSVVIEDVESPGQLGRLIAQHSTNATSRFRQLASEPDLIGQIGAALLLGDQHLNLIEAQTLGRIAGDLNVEEQARSWLQDAKRHLSKRAQVKGLTRRPRGTALTGARISQPPRPPIRPRMVLRYDQDDHWRLFQDVPDLTPLVRTFPDFQSIVSRAQVRIGSSTRPLPARAFLRGRQSIAQSIWPNPNEPLLEFKPSQRDLDALLEHACTIEPGPWLFRIGVDGTAREIRSRRVAEGGDYIVVGTHQQLENTHIGNAASIKCDDAVARRFEATCLDQLADRLSELGFGATRRVSAQPVGIVPSAWDREGSVEWLSTDRPLISLSANYAIEHYEIVLNVGAEDLLHSLRPESSSGAAIVQLPELHAGIYHLSVTAHPQDSRYPVEHGDMEIAIRDPVPAEEQVLGRNAMMVIEEPTGAALQDIFEGGLKIQVIGPPTRDINICIRLFKSRKVAPIADVELRAIWLPMSPDEWARRLGQLLENDTSFARAYQEANTCELTFDGGDLGCLASVYDRPFEPLRWAVTYSRDSMMIKLLEDTDDSQSVEIVRYEFSTPLVQRRVTQPQRDKAEKGEAKPGLYVARAASLIASVIVPFQSIDSLRSARPRFRRPERSEETVSIFLDAIDAWGHVSTTGNPFGRFAWRQSFTALIQQLAGLVAGTAWYKTELIFDRMAESNVDIFVDRIPYKNLGRRTAETLPLAIDDLLGASLEERVGIFQGNVHESFELARFALELASDPTDIRIRYGTLFGHMLTEVMRKSHVFRAARFVVLATSVGSGRSGSDSRSIYEGWTWN